MAVAKIKLSSLSYKDADSIMGQIKSIAESLDVKVSGPIPFPTKRLVQTTRKAPAGEGSHSYERWQMRIYTFRYGLSRKSVTRYTAGIP